MPKNAIQTGMREAQETGQDYNALSGTFRKRARKVAPGVAQTALGVLGKRVPGVIEEGLPVWEERQTPGGGFIPTEFPSSDFGKELGGVAGPRLIQPSEMGGIIAIWKGMSQEEQGQYGGDLNVFLKAIESGEVQI